MFVFKKGHHPDPSLNCDRQHLLMQFIIENTSQSFTFLTFISFFSSSAFARACRRRRIPWYCFALTYTGSCAISIGKGILACGIPTKGG